jgi:hypothetical protein
VSAGKPLATDDQPHDELLAVRPMVAGVAAFGLGDESRLSLEIGARQVIANIWPRTFDWEYLATGNIWPRTFDWEG